MLRESFKKELVDVIERNTDLYGEDFNFIETKTDVSNLRLEYIFNAKFYFNIKIIPEEIEFEKDTIYGKKKEKKEVNSFYCDMCPGPLFNDYQEKAHDIKELNRIYEDWTIRVSEDIKATSLYGKIERLNKEFEDFKQNIDKEDNTYFTYIEAQKLIERLEDLEKKLSEHFENDNLEEELTKIIRDIENLSSDVYSMTKNNWFKKFFSRFSHWVSNPKNQELIVSSAKNIKQLIDSSKQ